MGYVAKKVRDTKNGVSTIRLRADGTPYWQVVYEDRRKDRPANVSRETPIHQDQLEKLGIDFRFTIQQAKERCRHLNSKANLEKKNERSRARTIARENHAHLIQSVFLPPTIAYEFEKKVLFKRFAGNEESAKCNRLLSHWKFTQRLIADLEIEPKDYAEESFQIYRYLQKQRISLAYVVKILRVLNAWGQFYTRRSGGTGIEEVKMPRGKQRQDIARTCQAKDEYKGQADPLAPDELSKAERLLLDYNYNWLYLSVWLGLRPEEIDNLHEKKYWRKKLNVDGATPEIWVFQPKLTAVEEEKAWKPIPLWHPNQQQCLKIILDGNFKRPLNKTLGKVFPEKRITSYSGRKGFVDLMLSFEQPLEEIQIWMGHTSMDTTWKHYKQKQVVRFKKVG